MVIHDLVCIYYFCFYLQLKSQSDACFDYRIWNKKYPICILFSSPPSQIIVSDDESNDTDTSPVDYLQTIKQENSISSKKALYLFSLTDREKETLFWALKRNTTESDGKEKSSETTCDTLSKIDFSSMTYMSLVIIKIGLFVY